MGKRKLDQFDIDAEREGQALKRAYRGVCPDFDKRLKKSYFVDGYRFNNGEKHRAWSGLGLKSNTPLK